MEHHGQSADTISFVHAKQHFITMFRSHEDEFEPNAESQWIRLLYDKFQPWEDKWVNHHKIPFDEFATICIGTVVEVL